MSSTKIWVRGTQQIDALLRVWARKWDDHPRSAIAMHASDAVAGKSKGEEYSYAVHEKLLAHLRKHVRVEILDHSASSNTTTPEGSSRPTRLNSVKQFP
jgi:hypothetical protein